MTYMVGSSSQQQIYTDIIKCLICFKQDWPPNEPEYALGFKTICCRLIFHISSVFNSNSNF